MRALMVLSLAACCAMAQLKSLNPKVSAIVDAVSEDRIAATLKKLEGFETRHLLSSQDHPTRGIGAARKWIFAEMQGYSPKLQVSYDSYRVKQIPGAASRVTRDTELHNVVAVLPGKVHPEQRVLVTAHYDTIVFMNGVMQDPESFQPGVTDDGSGTACVMELARVMSQYEFDKTLVFIAFAGEEEGLLGSSLYSAKAKLNGEKIEAVLNNDIIGFEAASSGRAESRRLSVFSSDPNDSPARTLARYVRDIGERYVPSMKVDAVFRSDRVARGGDHTPFALEGYAAVRISSPQENLSNEHTVTDTFANTSPGYVARAARVNGAAAASLAFAPMAPASFNVARGAKQVDAVLSWKSPDEADLAGFAVVWRATTAPFWEREVYVGNATTYTMPDVSIDDAVFGVKAIDREGNESLVSPYVPAERAKRTVDVF